MNFTNKEIVLFQKRKICMALKIIFKEFNTIKDLKYRQWCLHNFIIINRKNRKAWAHIRVRKAEFHQKIRKDNCLRSIKVWDHRFKSKKKIKFSHLRSINKLSSGLIKILTEDEENILLPIINYKILNLK